MLLALIAATAVVPQGTWIVDANNGPGTQFTDLPPAVATAAHGDTILVRSGDYLAFQVSGKALTIRGAGASNARVVSSPNALVSAIQNVPAGSVFFLDGLHFEPDWRDGLLAAPAALRVSGSSTTVAIADCELRWQPGGVVAGHALAIDGATVLAARSNFFGSDVAGFLALSDSGGNGIQAVGATLVAIDCHMVGGDHAVSKHGASRGAAAVSLAGGLASLHACSLRGGNKLGLRSPSDGGHGLELLAAGSFARIAGSPTDTIEGGAGGLGSGLSIAALDPGAAVVVHGTPTLLPTLPSGQPLTLGNVVLGAAPLPRLDITGVTSAAGEIAIGNPITVQVDGGGAAAPCLAGVDALPAVSTALAPLTLGEVLLPTASFQIALVLDGGGRFVHTFSTAAVPALVGQPVFSQAAVLDVAGNRIRMSNLGLHLYTN
ncbi:MAG: hypothetical protein AB7O97_11610 [Planctomycetota bacterium]